MDSGVETTHNQIYDNRINPEFMNDDVIRLGLCKFLTALVKQDFVDPRAGFTGEE